MAQHKKQTGFTIVELLIVIVVIGILAALTLNSFAGAQQKARNAQTISLVKAYHTAISAYAAEKGSYPPDWACLGSGYPDADNNGTAGDCEGDNTYGSWLTENGSFNAAIQPYVGSGDNKVNPKIITASWGQWAIGAIYRYESNTTLDGQPQNRWITYQLEGKDSKCSAGPIVKMDTWPAFSSGSWNGVTEDWWDNGNRCWIPLPQQP